ncbi:hypothetical protein A4244_19405 [Bacillus badius]|nr:hypothetical protein A4244_19405 [Bacillus badius]OCS84233.1 hypothetical protein A6M11_19420 [Bacillus badius]OVE45824.1 helix-turn-helix domain-containing protein [Bacillus badius]TDV97064.1 transposase-like protein [Bacillus badius]
MTKYSLQTKLNAVHDFLNGYESYKTVADKHNVDMTLLKEWVRRFEKQGPSAFEVSYTNYPIEFKMDVLTYMNETGASTVEAAAVFNIPSSAVVRKWRQLFVTQGIDALQPKKKGRQSMKNKKEKNKPTVGSEEALRAENEQLRMEIAYLKKLHALIQEKEKLQNRTKRK